MRVLGFVLFFAGIGVASVYASYPAHPDVEEGEEPSPSARISAWADGAGVGFGIGAILMITGAVVVRRDRGTTEGPGGGRAGHAERAPDTVRKIRERLEGLPVDELPERAAEVQAGLDEILEELAPSVIDRREALIASMGLGPFAEMIGQFSTIERNAARAWSALIDEAYDEVPGCVERAKDAATRTLEALEKKK
jgi:hypothetical protein